MTRSWSVRMRRTARSRRGLVIMFAWAVAEALWWPLVPDSFLMGLAFAAPKRWRKLWVAALAGTITGGLIGLALTDAGWNWGLPLVTDRMLVAADGWLGEGASGLAHQPLSGVPYKAFVTQASQHDISTWTWISATALFRGGRMLVAGGLAAAAGTALWRWTPRRWAPRLHASIVAVATVVLFAGLAVVVKSWS